jgi:thiamine transport system ATP-binding protein
MLEIRSLAFHFTDFAAQYDLVAPTGSFTGLIGPSGSGKTTLLDGLAGFSTSASGQLLFDGVDLLPLAPAQRPISVIFQDDNLFPHLSAWQNVALGLRPDLKLDDAQRQRIADTFAAVELTGKEGRKPHELSGGERQRVAIARAFAGTKPLLLLDEPFGALDPGLRLAMIELIDRLRRLESRTVLLSIHTPLDLLGFADQVAFVSDGQIMACGDARAILETGDNPLVKRYLGKREAGAD